MFAILSSVTEKSFSDDEVDYFFAAFLLLKQFSLDDVPSSNSYYLIGCRLGLSCSQERGMI